MHTVWILGDQLHPDVSSLAGTEPGQCCVLFIESRAKVGGRRWHRQRAHLVLTAMRRFAGELREQGHTVDYRRAESFAAGLQAHRAEFAPERIVATEPMSWDALARFGELGVEPVRSNQFLCHYDEFAEWAEGRKSLTMEHFYRWQRSRLGYLMDGDQPVEGRWNFDHDNREPPPRDGRAWQRPPPIEPDDIDAAVLATVEEWTEPVGAEPSGIWPTSRAQALERLHDFVDHALGPFGPYEDAMLTGEWKLAHSALASSMNIGLLHPAEICDAAEAAYREGRAPIASVEGFIRQIIGWREYVWGLYWLWMPEYRDVNVLDAQHPIPPALLGGETEMACVSDVVARVDSHGYVHHIERLMILGNLALLIGVKPQAMVDWMWERFVDGAEWVMIPNVLGMALHADGGRMATKPYAAGGRYINKMSNFCKGCRFDPTKRTGEKACPFTTLYWDFLARNEAALTGNHRLGNQLGGMRRLADLDAVRTRAAEVIVAIGAGEL